MNLLVPEVATDEVKRICLDLNGKKLRATGQKDIFEVNIPIRKYTFSFPVYGKPPTSSETYYHLQFVCSSTTTSKIRFILSNGSAFLRLKHTSVIGS